MRITRLQARDFGRHRDLDIELAGGVTVVRGPNEAGKSTIQRILELALTRKVTSANTDLDAGEVAFLLGFEEVNSFTRAFHAWEGTTPTRWRESDSRLS